MSGRKGSSQPGKARRDALPMRSHTVDGAALLTQAREGKS